MSAVAEEDMNRKLYRVCMVTLAKHSSCEPSSMLQAAVIMVHISCIMYELT